MLKWKAKMSVVPVLGCALILGATLFAKTLGEDHQAGNAVLGNESSMKDTTAIPTTVTMTREDALVQGLRKINLQRAALGKIMELAQARSNLDVKGFDDIVEKFVPKEGSQNAGKEAKITREQADHLKKLFKDELGSVKDSELGKEFGKAAKRVLDNQKSPGQASNQLAGQNPEQGKANNPVAGKTVPVDSALLDKLLAKMDQSSEPAGKSGISEELGKQLGKLQDMLKNVAGKGQLAPREGRLGKNRGLLDALRGALGKGKDDKDKKDKGNGLEGLADSLKNAMPQHAMIPKPNGDDEDDGKKDIPEPQKDEPKTDKKEEDKPNLAAFSKGNKSKGNDDKKDKKESKPFELGSSKKDRDKPPPDDDDDKPEDDPFEDPGDPSGLLEALRNSKKGKKLPIGKTSSLPTIGQSGGSFGDVGSLGAMGSPGGSGPMGPPIVGSSSPLPSSGLSGEPTASDGKNGFNGQEAGGYQFAKKVEYGSSSGGNAGDGEEEFVGDYGYNDFARKKENTQTTQLVLSPIGNENGGEPRSLLDYIGNMGKSLCEGVRKFKVGMCKKLTETKYLSSLKKKSLGLPK